MAKTVKKRFSKLSKLLRIAATVSLLLFSSNQIPLSATPMLKISVPGRIVLLLSQTTDGVSIFSSHPSYADILRYEPINALGVTAGVTATENQAINPPAAEWAAVNYLETTSFNPDYLLVGDN